MRHDELPWDEPEAVHVRRITFDPPTQPPSPPSPDSPGSPAVPRDASRKPFTNRAFCAHVLSQQAKFKTWLDDPKSTVRANVLVILCTRACLMMESYIRNLGESFKQEGGFREKMGEARREQRTEAHATEDAQAPQCEACGSMMRLVRRKADNNPFWGCSNYPGCRGTRPYAKAEKKF
jgi:four helix bundle suffix protein